MLKKIHPFRFWSQKVLPLVYDDSLSYYEVLGKLTRKVNEIISNLDPMIREVIEDMGLSPESRYENVYNAKDYGAKGDGSTDDYDSIQELLTKCKDAGGGIVFLPAGKYMIRQCLIVGDNCSLLGTGTGTEIYNTDASPFWGTTIGVVGSNAMVGNLKVNYYDYSSVPIASGPAWGAIGITNCEYEDAVNQRRGASLPNIKNITIKRIWTDGFYALQCEPVSVIENVVYSEIFAPNSIVSVQAGSTYNNSRGYLYNFSGSNIFCSYMRAIGFAYADGVALDKIFANYCYLACQGVKLSNSHIASKVGNPFSGATFPVQRATLMIHGTGNRKSTTIDNTEIDACGVEDYAINCQNGSGIVMLSNVKSINANVSNLNIIDAVVVYANNCRFDMSDSAIENNAIGYFTSSVLNQTEIARQNSLILFRIEPITVEHDGFVTLHNNAPVNCFRNGQVCVLSGSLRKSEGNFAEGDVIGTTSMHPITTCKAICNIESSVTNDTAIAVLTWNTSGQLILNSLVQSVTNYDGIVFNVTGC